MVLRIIRIIRSLIRVKADMLGVEVVRRNEIMAKSLSSIVLEVLLTLIIKLIINSFFVIFNGVNATSLVIIFGPSRLMLRHLSVFSSSLTA